MSELFGRDVHCILGLPFDAVDMAGTVGRLYDAASGRRGCFLTTPNLNWLIACQADTALRDSVFDSDLSIVDGMPLVWIARWLGVPIRERVAGSALFEALRRSRSRQLTIYFFGGPEGVAATACQKLNETAVGLRCVGYDCPGFGSVEDMSSEATIARINAANPDFVVVSLGAKKGQAWIERNRNRLSAPVISHLGAVVNFVAGTVSRAPGWVQRSGLEWLWRIKEEPALWRRYFSDGVAFLRLLATRVLPYAAYMKRHKPDSRQAASARVEVGDEPGVCLIRCSGALTIAGIEQLRSSFANAAAAGSRDIELRMENATFVDSAFLGLVMLLYGHQRRLGGKLVVKGLSEELRAVFRWNCIDYMCDLPASM